MFAPLPRIPASALRASNPASAEPPRIPGYRLLWAIGSGRRSTAWLAEDLDRGGKLVLKLQQARASALHRDAAVAARVQGDSLVRVLDHGRTSQWDYLAMEHVAGGELAARMRAGLGRDEALTLFAQAARAVAKLHRAGLVHRDLKPANFLLRADGRLVLADYGLVVAIGHSDPRFAEGAVFGTPRYVAPEQLQGAPAAPAADVYSLGVLLHEMLAGRPPFPGETLMEVLSQHLLAQPARLQYPLADLQPLVDRMLAKEEQRRLADADAVLGLMAGGADDPE
jgi:serine/threonine protein kinase